MHFFNPAPLMALVEIVTGLATAPEVAQTLANTARAWGKSPVFARSTPGFIVNRIARPFYAEALRVLQENGGDPATLDGVMREAGGFRMGPFELMDLIGHDVNFAVTRSVHAAYFGDPRFTPSIIQQELVEARRLGRKSGRGFYDYSKGAEKPAPRQLPPSPAPAQLIAEGDFGTVEPLILRLQKSGIDISRRAGRGRGACLIADGVLMVASDGRTATERAAAEGLSDVVVWDVALDWSQASRIAIAVADQASPCAVPVAAGVFQAAGVSVSLLNDVAGLIVTRTVAMLANEAADALLYGVATAEDIDTAMEKGVNYPRGPLAWADALQSHAVVAVLENLARTYGEDRYRVSPMLRRMVDRNGFFHTKTSRGAA
jgi:3-hydroxybutyryl-CoA dehydrogenase